MGRKPDTNQSRRAFLAACGKFAVVTPPALSLMLASSQSAYALVSSGGSTPVGSPPSSGGGPKTGSTEWYDSVLRSGRSVDSMDSAERELWFNVNGGRSTYRGGIFSFR